MARHTGATLVPERTRATSGTTATIIGVVADSDFVLESGWNLVGMAGNTSLTDIASSVRAAVVAWRWSAESQSYTPLGQDAVLQRCHGYWLHVEEAAPRITPSDETE